MIHIIIKRYFIDIFWYFPYSERAVTQSDIVLPVTDKGSSGSLGSQGEMELPRNGRENSNGSLQDYSKHKTVINVSGDQFDAPPSVFSLTK